MPSGEPRPERLIVEPYTDFIGKPDVTEANGCDERSTTDSSIAKGRSKRNRRTCHLLMADEFVNPVGPKWRQKSESNAKNSTGTANDPPIDMESSADNSTTPPIKYGVGCLVWARITGHPWWPCMVCNDVDGSHEYTKLSGPRRSRRNSFVEFFGPSVEHAWIADTALIEYKGMEEFKSYAQKQVDEAPSKVIKEKLAERFQLKVALSKRAHWEEAVKEADKVVQLSIDDRLKWRESKLGEIQKRNATARVPTPRKSATTSSLSSSMKRRPSSISFHSEDKKSTRRSAISTKSEPEKDSQRNVARPATDAPVKLEERKSLIQKKATQLPRRLDACIYCKMPFSDRKRSVAEISGHLISCSKASPNKRLLRCPFCYCSFRQPRWNPQRRKTHICGCARKVYGKNWEGVSATRQTSEEPKARRFSVRLGSGSVATRSATSPAGEPTKPTRASMNSAAVATSRQRLRVVSSLNTGTGEASGSVTTTLTTPTTRRLLIKYPPRLYGRRSLQPVQKTANGVAVGRAVPLQLPGSVSQTAENNALSEQKTLAREDTREKIEPPATTFTRNDRGITTPLKSSLTASELHDRLDDRYQALEATARGTPLADVSLRFQLPRSVIETDFYGDFSTIADKAVILGRLDLATRDIEEGTRASIAALKYRLPYKYLLMIIRGKSQECAVEQFYADFEQWRAENLKRPGADPEQKTTTSQITPRPSPKRQKLAFRSSSNPVSSGRHSLLVTQKEDPIGGSRTTESLPAHPLYTISDDEAPAVSAANSQSSCAPNEVPRLNEEEELRIVQAVTSNPDKLRAGQLAISSAKQMLRSRCRETAPEINKDWWHFMLLKYPAMRHSLLNYYHQKQLEQRSGMLPSSLLAAKSSSRSFMSTAAGLSSPLRTSSWPKQLSFCHSTPFLVSERSAALVQDALTGPVKAESSVDRSHSSTLTSVRKSARIAKRKN